MMCLLVRMCKYAPGPLRRQVAPMDVTPQMASKWVKAVFLILLAIVLLMYSDGFVDDLERNSAEEFNISFEWTWDLVRVLIWILIAWLFVDAVLIIILSLKTQLYTVDDVMERLKSIEKRLPEATPAGPPPVMEPQDDYDMYPAVEPADESDDDLPPPMD